MLLTIGSFLSVENLMSYRSPEPVLKAEVSSSQGYRRQGKRTNINNFFVCCERRTLVDEIVLDNQC